MLSYGNGWGNASLRNTTDIQNNNNKNILNY
jgi:hypothetical protein